MASSHNIFPVSKRPLEYVAFFSVKIATQEGNAHLFTAYDPYIDFIFSLSVERDESPENVLKNIYFLMENPRFVPYMDNGFTLVFEKYEELSDNYLTRPVIQSLSNYLNIKKDPL